jgi:glutathionyl-hydroquinone reductase
VGYQSLSGYLRDLMDADAAAETTNAEVIARIARDREPAMNC